jgi:hypothetical protein
LAFIPLKKPFIAEEEEEEYLALPEFFCFFCRDVAPHPLHTAHFYRRQELIWANQQEVVATRHAAHTNCTHEFTRKVLSQSAEQAR